MESDISIYDLTSIKHARYFMRSRHFPEEFLAYLWENDFLDGEHISNLLSDYFYTGE